MQSYQAACWRLAGAFHTKLPTSTHKCRLNTHGRTAADIVPQPITAAELKQLLQQRQAAEAHAAMNPGATSYPASSSVA